jgi:hypothetical protein
MNDIETEMLRQLILVGIATLFFTVWSAYWYRNAEKVDRWMMDDRTRKFVEHIPKEERLKKFRRHMIPGLIGIVTLWIFFLWRLTQFLQAFLF